MEKEDQTAIGNNIFRVLFLLSRRDPPDLVLTFFSYSCALVAPSMMQFHYDSSWRLHRFNFGCQIWFGDINCCSNGTSCL